MLDFLLSFSHSLSSCLILHLMFAWNHGNNSLIRGWFFPAFLCRVLLFFNLDYKSHRAECPELPLRWFCSWMLSYTRTNWPFSLGFMLLGSFGIQCSNERSLLCGYWPVSSLVAWNSQLFWPELCLKNLLSHFTNTAPCCSTHTGPFVETEWRTGRRFRE